MIYDTVDGVDSGGLLRGGLLCGIVPWLWGRIQRQAENERKRLELTQAQTERQVAQDRLQWMEQAQEQMREAFEALASQSLRANSDEFLKRVRDQMDGMLAQVRGDWKAQKAEFQSLVDPIKEMGDQTMVRDLSQVQCIAPRPHSYKYININMLYRFMGFQTWRRYGLWNTGVQKRLWYFILLT